MRPPPRTSPRVLVACVPWRAAASWATTTWWINGTLVCTSKSSAGSSTVPASPPVGLVMETVVIEVTPPSRPCGPGRCRRGGRGRHP
ncbi:hypothetical protein [Ornithinimicrobium kibberense]|uniref:hypothetical protein n=1 Tax=Ornithinimicrobium kibberense TaxID=282060 RepID=UPI00360AEC87